MHLFETSSMEREVCPTLEHVGSSLALILSNRAREVSFEDLYRALYDLVEGDNGCLVEQITFAALGEAIESKFSSFSSETPRSLSSTIQQLKEILAGIDTMTKAYFYFDCTHFLKQKNTTLKRAAYHMLKQELVKKQELFMDFLRGLMRTLLRIKKGGSGEEETGELNEALEIIHRLDNESSSVQIFNHYLKGLYIQQMVIQVREKLHSLRENHQPQVFFETMMQDYIREKEFIERCLMKKKDDLVATEILKSFYTTWIIENWSFLSDGSSMDKLLSTSFTLVYQVMRLDPEGEKLFVSWYLQNLGSKLNHLAITNNQTLIESFSVLYRKVIEVTNLGEDPLVYKINRVFEMWLNNDKIDIANRLNSHIHQLIAQTTSSNHSLQDLQKALVSSMVVFKFLKDKDVFELAYSRALLQRMSSEMYVREMEETVMSLMKEECGESWAVNIESIILQNATLEYPNCVVNLNGDWHSLVSKEPFVTNKDLIEFHKTTVEKTNKEAKWLLNYGHGVIGLSLQQSFQVKASTRILQILLTFNHHIQITVEKYLKETGFQIEAIQEPLLTLIKEGLVLGNNSTVTTQADITPSLVLSLNEHYQPNNKLVIIDQLKEQKSLSLTSKQQLTEDRRLVVEGFLTKEMKQSKSLSVEVLMQQTWSKMDNKGFVASKSLIDSCISALIDKGYIKVQNNTATYLP